MENPIPSGVPDASPAGNGPDSRLPHRVLVSHAPDTAFAPHTRALLAKLGYAIAAEEDWSEVSRVLGCERPDLRIVDERNLGDLPDDDVPAVPVIVLTGRYGVTGADSRIAGAVRRPAGLHELYRLIQQLCEDTPRSAPRVPTHLPARCARKGRSWPAALLSLSENGCLLRSAEPLPLGSKVELRFRLPRRGTIEVEAEMAYQLVPDLGMVFHAAPPDAREAIADYVLEALGTL